MHQSAELWEKREISFKKGMTLEQYMAGPVFETRQEDSLDEAVEENLYESSQHRLGAPVFSRKRHYRIDEIDEESVQDSKDYHKGNQSRETPGFEHSIHIQDALVDSTEPDNPVKGRANSISMSTAITFKHNQEPTSFRVKRMSVSPQRKKSELPIPNGSITLYGCKFGHKPPKPQSKLPEMLTFYGKLHLDSGEEALSRKSSTKQSDLKQKFTKKGQFQLNKALQFDPPPKYNNLSKHIYPDLRVQGHRDRAAERRNRFN